MSQEPEVDGRWSMTHLLYNHLARRHCREAHVHEGLLEVAHSAQSVIFAALALESFINYYLRTSMSARDFERFDTLRTESKWLLGPMLRRVDRFPTAGQPYEDITWLFGARNRLVHFKPKRKAFGEGEPLRPIATRAEAQRAVRAIDGAVEALAALHGEQGVSNPIYLGQWHSSAEPDLEAWLVTLQLDDPAVPALSGDGRPGADDSSSTSVEEP